MPLLILAGIGAIWGFGAMFQTVAICAGLFIGLMVLLILSAIFSS